ncbi:MAG: sigma factor-like helix-turn-helix DNA-binding protein [Ktedonobacterales bacterium]
MSDDVGAPDADPQFQPIMTPKQKREHERAQVRKRAQARLDTELAALPAWGTSELEQRLLALRKPDALSHGAVVHYIRYARRLDQQPAPQPPVSTSSDVAFWHTLFMTLLRRLHGLNERWVRAMVAQETRLALRDPQNAQNDLRQHLDLLLLEGICDETKVGWELFFRKSLHYTRLNAMRRYLNSQGYDVRAHNPPHFVEWLQGELATSSAQDDTDAHLADPRDELTGADYADLLSEVLQLPYKLKVTIIMRYWEDETFETIAAVLNRSTRSVKGYQCRALKILKQRYARKTGSWDN